MSTRREWVYTLLHEAENKLEDQCPAIDDLKCVWKKSLKACTLGNDCDFSI